MSKQVFPLNSPDISAFARALGRQLQTREAAPSHLEVMNMLARAAGYRNFQHLRAAHAAEARLDTPALVAAVDFRLVERALNQFDAAGRLLRWPSRRQIQLLCLWALWSRFPAGVSLHEREVNARLNAAHGFGDAALLRRDLCGLGLFTRSRDGSDYRRQELPPPPEARELIRRLRGLAPN